MIGNDSLQGSAEGRVLICPAQTEKVVGKRVHFLFSVLQIVDIMKNLSVQPVPFSASYIEGIAKWRDQIIPIVFLEDCLGLATQDIAQYERLVVVRSADRASVHVGSLLGGFKVASAIRMLSLPINCSPASNGWIPDTSLVRGIYEWDEGFLVVVRTENILSGNLSIGV